MHSNLDALISPFGILELKNSRLSLALLLLLLLITSVVAQQSSYNYYRQNSYRQKTSRPNILFILADDLGWNDVGWVNPEVITPNLDSMATKGVILNQSYAQPLCTPSRAAYLTGLYPFHTGMQSFVVRTQVAEFLPLKFTLLPEKLKEAGYSTHLVGKWHLGYCRRDVTPTFRGFESFLGIYTGYVDFFTKRALSMPITRLSDFDTNKPRTVYDFHSDLDLYPSPPDDYITEVFTDKAVEIIEKHDEDHPLFLALHHVAPHFPLQAPQRYLDLYPNVTNEDRRIYLGMVTAMDEGIGQVVQALKRKGILENTIIVFESDNGGDTNFGASNFPLRGRKSNLYEGGVRVPTFVYSPGLLLSTPRVSEDLFHLVDWFPTLLKAAGINTDVDAVDGKDQWDMIRYGFKGPRDILIYNINGDDAAIRVGRFKLTEGNPGGFLRRNKRSVDATEPELHITVAEALTEDLVHADEPNVREKRSASYHGHRTGYGGRSGYRHTTLESDEDKIVKALEGLDDQWNIDSARQSGHLTVDTILDLLEAFGPNTPPGLLICNCELYDLNADSSENQDLASQKPALVQFLHNLLVQFRVEEVEPVVVQPIVIDPRSVPSISNNVTSNTWCEEKRHRNRFYDYNHHLSYRRSYP